MKKMAFLFWLLYLEFWQGPRQTNWWNRTEVQLYTTFQSHSNIISPSANWETITITFLDNYVLIIPASARLMNMSWVIFAGRTSYTSFIHRCKCSRTGPPDTWVSPILDYSIWCHAICRYLIQCLYWQSVQWMTWDSACHKTTFTL